MSLRGVFAVVVWALIMLVSGSSVFVIERNLIRIHQERRDLERLIIDYRRNIRLLRAEKSYLLRPDRLEYMARRHLSLTPSRPARGMHAANRPGLKSTIQDTAIDLPMAMGHAANRPGLKSVISKSTIQDTAIDSPMAMGR